MERRRLGGPHRKESPPRRRRSTRSVRRGARMPFTAAAPPFTGVPMTVPPSVRIFAAVRQGAPMDAQFIDDSPRSQTSTKLIIGLFLAVLGILLTADNLN